MINVIMRDPNGRYYYISDPKSVYQIMDLNPKVPQLLFELLQTEKSNSSALK